MNKKRKRLYFPPLTVGLFVVAAALLSVFITRAIMNYQPKPEELTEAERYELAVNDAMIIESDEIYPVIKLTDEKMASTNELGQVLLITWHDTPYLYLPEAYSTLNYGTVWGVADGELLSWYTQNASKIDTESQDAVVARFEQLLGLPPKTGYSHFSGVWVWMEDLRRPAYTPETGQTEMQPMFVGTPEESYKNWFDNTIIEKYYDKRFPWTRLGYTYDWAPDDVKLKAGNEYGLSEFVIIEGSEVRVGFTYTNGEFFDWLEESRESAEKDKLE